MSSFFSELQRRNVYKVGAMYCVAGWLLVQVVTQVFPIFHVSELAQRIIVLAVVAGFPIALVLSWIYELTPQGIVKTGEVALDASITRATGQRLNRAIIGTLGLAVLVLLAKVIWPQVLSAAAKPQTPADTDKSVAVLPFENLSDDKANAYFSEGIQDQVLTQLAKIGALRVISRTSTQQYASKPASVTEIAAQLGVANVLEGSVQKAGNAVRINVQLIRAAGDQHLWAETYDRTLDNVFGVESDVAEAIAQALNAKLSGAEQRELAVLPTRDAAAWEDYLRAKVLYVRFESLASSREAEDALRDAVQRAPGFVEAWALLAQVRASENIENWDTSAAAHAEALAAVQQAERLRPDGADTRAARAYYQFWIERDYEAAQRGFEQALQRAPGSADILSALAFVKRRQGQWQQSLDYFDKAIAVDPRNLEYLGQAAVTATANGNYALAQRYVDRCLAVAPREPEVLALQAWLYQGQGRLDRAEPVLASFTPDPADLNTIFVFASQKLFQRRYAEGAALMRTYLEHMEPSWKRERTFVQFQLGEFERLAGNAASARAAYLRALDNGLEVLADQPQNGDLLNRLALIEMRLGDGASAMDYSRHARQTVPRGGDALSMHAVQYTLARVQAAAGNNASAIATLRQLLSGPTLDDSDTEPSLTPATLRLNPEWDALRDDPRFQQLLTDAAR